MNKKIDELSADWYWCPLKDKIMEAWKTFYRPYFKSEKLLSDFIETCEGLDPDDSKHRAKIMMHQGQRLISLSENAAILEAERDPLKLFFLIVCAEAVAKLHADYKKGVFSKLMT